jgi:uncharacterized protein (DUF2267 family)
MSAPRTGVDSLDRAIAKTDFWLKELDAELGFGNRERTYRALREGLHALRDHLAVEEVAQLGAQLPMLIRGLFYDGWRPQAKPPAKDRHKEEFLVALGRCLVDQPGRDVERAARCVFRFIASWVSASEMADVRDSLPRELRDLLPQ